MAPVTSFFDLIIQVTKTCIRACELGYVFRLIFFIKVISMGFIRLVSAVYLFKFDRIVVRCMEKRNQKKRSEWDSYVFCNFVLIGFLSWSITPCQIKRWVICYHNIVIESVTYYYSHLWKGDWRKYYIINFLYYLRFSQFMQCILYTLRVRMIPKVAIHFVYLFPWSLISCNNRTWLKPSHI